MKMTDKQVGFLALGLGVAAIALTIGQMVRIDRFMKGATSSMNGDDSVDFDGNTIKTPPSATTQKKKGDKGKLNGKDVLYTDNTGSWIYV